MQHRTGDLADLPQLDIGEFGFATDQNRLFIGNDPLQHPVSGGQVTNTEILTSDPNCSISLSQLTGNLSIAVGNIKITGGSNGRVLQTDGNGNLSWVTVPGAGSGAPGGATGQIQYNSSGAFTGSGNLLFNDSTNTLTVDAIITGTIGASGNISGNLIIGNGSQLTALPGANVTGQVPNSLVAGTVYTHAQPNITSVGTLANLTVTGNISGNVFSGNGSGLTHIAGANITGWAPNANIANTVASNAQPNITSVGTLTSLVVTGNISSSGAYIGDGGLLSNIHGGNITGTISNANLAVTVSNAAQPNITSLGTLSSLVVTGNINSSGVYIGDGGKLSNIAGANVIGIVPSANIANVANLATTITSGAQPNITSTGILTSLKVSGNVTAAYIVGDGSQITNALPRRSNVSVTTGSLSNNASTNATITGFKGYMLYSIQTSVPAWVTVYSSVGLRTLDASRTMLTDPLPGSGVITEVITANNTPILYTPAIVGFSSEASPDGNIQIKVNNQSGSTQSVTVTMTILGIED